MYVAIFRRLSKIQPDSALLKLICYRSLVVMAGYGHVWHFAMSTRGSILDDVAVFNWRET